MAQEERLMLKKLTCSLCYKEKFECDVETRGDLVICKACIERELTDMVFERVGKQKKEAG